MSACRLSRASSPRLSPQPTGTIERLEIGYVVVDTTEASDALVAFARQAFRLTLISRAQNLELYRTPLTPPVVVTK